MPPAMEISEIPFGTTIRGDSAQARHQCLGGDVPAAWWSADLRGECCRPTWQTPFDFEPLQKIGAIVGSGTIEVLPLAICMVNWAARRRAYLTHETCGKCVPCRIGEARRRDPRRHRQRHRQPRGSRSAGRILALRSRWLALRIRRQCSKSPGDGDAKFPGRFPRAPRWALSNQHSRCVRIDLRPNRCCNLIDI